MVTKPETSGEYKFMFEISPIPSWVFQKKSLKFLDVNSAACKKYGYTKAEFLEMQITDIKNSADKIALKRYLVLEPEEKQSACRFWEHINKKGSSFYVQVHCVDIDYKGEEATLVQAVDVNDMVLSDYENKKLNALVNTQKEQLDNILSSVNEVVWAANADTMELLYANNSSSKVFGYKPEEIIKDKNLFLNSIHTDDIAKFFQSVSDAKVLGESDCVFRVYHKNGSIRTLKGHAVYKPGRLDAPNLLSGITTDITDRLQMQEKLQQKIDEEMLMKHKIAVEEYNLRALINNTADLIWSIDREKKLITVNEPFKKIMNDVYGIELVTGYNMSGIDVTGEVFKQWEEYYARVFNGESFAIVDEQVVMGKKIYLKIRFNPIFDENKMVIGASCFAQDVTEQRTRLIRMQLQNERLKEIAWIHSHKVRGPVATMMGLAELFNREQPEDMTNQEIIDGMKKTLDELDCIIREINEKTITGEVLV